MCLTFYRSVIECCFYDKKLYYCVCLCKLFNRLFSPEYCYIKRTVRISKLKINNRISRIINISIIEIFDRAGIAIIPIPVNEFAF